MLNTECEWHGRCATYCVQGHVCHAKVKVKCVFCHVKVKVMCVTPRSRSNVFCHVKVKLWSHAVYLNKVKVGHYDLSRSLCFASCTAEVWYNVMLLITVQTFHIA